MPISLEKQNKERRQRIIQCSLDLFIEKGYYNTSIRDIIALSGVGTGTFYNYFVDKEDILKNLLEDFAKQIISSISEYYLVEKDLYERFIETKRLTMEVFAQNETLSEIYSRVAGSSAPIDQCLKQFEDRLLEFYSRNIEYGIKKGIFKNIPVSPIAHSILAMEKFSLYKWVVLKAITKEEMIEMVLSFHKTLAVGLLVVND
ncbi:TetR/AcrR family transcriptional regulator [Syntrophomonas wolfei]|jgi:AcrR family transcriptional regulator|uniref:TetR/AcrR family transcriptional regulator n=1 Tax=Syntrophomonas wolfei TaxID=863 RepID=UPI0023F50AAF|nr:TetR/AcrR family transcriptional regulator [Syntrophomonas wolfei]